MRWQPGRAGLFEPGLEDMSVSAFDQARTDRQTQRQGTGIVQRIEAMAQRAMTLSDRGLFIPRVPAASRCSARAAMTSAAAPRLRRSC